MPRAARRSRAASASLFPRARLRSPTVENWTGLRPATPSNVPVIGRTRLQQPLPEYRPRHARLDARVRLGQRARRPRLRTAAAGGVPVHMRESESRFLADPRPALPRAALAARPARRRWCCCTAGWMSRPRSSSWSTRCAARLGCVCAGLARLRADASGARRTATGSPTTSPTWMCLLEQIDAEKPVNLVGHSLGGNVAALVRRRAPGARRTLREPGRLRHAADAPGAGAEALCALARRAARCRRGCGPTRALPRWRERLRKQQPAALARKRPSSSRGTGARRWRARASCCAATRRTRSSTRCSTATRRCAPAGSRSTAPVLWVEAAESDTLKRVGLDADAARRAPRRVPQSAHVTVRGLRATCCTMTSRRRVARLLEEFLAR